MFVNVYNRNRWVAAFVADEYVTDGSITHFFSKGEFVGVTDSQSSTVIRSAIPAGDPVRRETGTRKPLKEGGRV